MSKEAIVSEIEKFIDRDREEKRIKKLTEEHRTLATSILKECQSTSTPEIPIQVGQEKFIVYLEESSKLGEGSNLKPLRIYFDEAGRELCDKKPKDLYEFCPFFFFFFFKKKKKNIFICSPKKIFLKKKKKKRRKLKKTFFFFCRKVLF